MATQTLTKMNPLQALSACGQSVWLDYIRRSLITSGELKRLIEEDGLRGVTSNPAIFEKAISGSTDYSETLDELRQRKDMSPMAMFEQIAIHDIQDAADVLRAVYDETNQRDGYVSLEVSPFLAADTEATIKEARRLWQAVSRPNLMIKVPGTPAGLPAIEQLISEGMNVNVTLLFSQTVYEQVAEAYLAGLETRAKAGKGISHIASVASFFVSRIDSAVEQHVDACLKRSHSPDERLLLQNVRGKVAIANARLAYQKYKALVKSDRWRKLADKGAQTQRLLWASTSTKSPSYSDVLYVEELVGTDTVNTIPPATMDAFRDHGEARASLEEGVEEARNVLRALDQTGISLDAIVETLVNDGVKSFAEAFDKLLNAVDTRCRFAAGVRISKQFYHLPESLEAEVKRTLEDWRVNGKVRRLWARDASLWTGLDESKWLGWLGITEDLSTHDHHLRELAEEVKKAAFSHVLLLGMGGSSLCPEVLKMSFGKVEGFPELHVLDSTDPAQIKACEESVDLANTLFIVSSKSGATLEPNIFKQYFFERVTDLLGAEKAGERFIAVTDPGSQLEKVAHEDGFRHVFHGDPSIGGRYSALSNFGMAPAAVMGVDTVKFLDRADEMAVACSSCQLAEENPGVVLGTVLGVLGNAGLDKVTIIASPGIRDLGAWLEQLLAESTGKEGKGLIPVDREPLGSPEVYGDDRLFVYARLDAAPDRAQDQAVEALLKAGHPVVRIEVSDQYDLGQEFFRWEIATAVAGSILGINPFNQPDVETSKVATRELTSAYEKNGSLPPEQAILEDGGIKLFADEKNAATLMEAVGKDKTLAGYVKAHLNRLGARDYFGLLAYVEMNEPHEARLQQMRQLVRDRKLVATCLGFGPRFLHSTGQAYKGGSNTGVFLQITADDANDLQVPGQKYTFGTVKAAQARGDFRVLAERNRRALRIHLGANVPAGLAKLQAAVQAAMA